MSYKLSMKAKQAIITVHVLSVVCWLGGAAVMLLLGLHVLRAESGDQLHYTLENMHLVDVVMIRYTALVALLTGLVLSIWTHWGLFKYYWIVIKLILTVGLIVFGIQYMGSWLSQLMRDGDLLRDLALGAPGFRQTGYSLMGGAIANIAALVFMTAISYFKPFGKINGSQKGKG
ncbi:hypothetical protein [Paenibacillus mucilaginosus]|uniref:Integral membrane protein n=2 Tax=Paenibacillus mucilaginosus TaxID=61624 RepID=H6NCR9_9BACL|nr:hypothetical protein [Paenibacillus mucilaginosus]AEI40372.1 hypothetical protein KNP414_01810 [Paenibacillus mucilaginosus KNP414]AFC28998.1 hypothetical protein PM3016_2102 [Paenibacillus mucilaginosus 3016]MCG7213274.1 hypothetical protein [Paenibacillus mucilaginosus]WDM29567.1 hypothetical protein KCX80_10610 [Paenibacillus mucilaginosus]WFA17744.1 hypothetical protein ERY13_10870 [Paenibacillus mucilaginosus]